MKRGASAATAALILVIAGAGMSAPQGAPAQSTAGSPPRGSARDDASPPGPGERPRGEGFRRSGAPGLTPDMMKRVIEVAHDVSPDMGKQLAASSATVSPDDMSHAMRQNARRLIALAVLRERNPDLYQTRVQDLRLQMELQALSGRYMVAKAAGDTSELATLDVEIATKAKRQVEADLKARGQELKALSDQLDEMRKDLQAALGQTSERVAQRIEAVKTGQADKSRVFGGEGGPRGPRDERD